MMPFFLIPILFFICLNVSGKEIVKLFTYQNKPPFIISQESKHGLAYDFIDLMNKYSSKYEFKMLLYPKKRIDEMESKIYFLTNPVWLNDAQKKKFLYSDAIMEDRNLFVTPVLNKDVSLEKNLNNEDTLFLVLIGSIYKSGIEKKKKTHHFQEEIQIIRFIIERQMGFGIISHSTLRYFLSLYPTYKNKIYIYNTPEYEFTRHFAFSKDKAYIHKEIQEILQTTVFQENLKILLKKY